MEWLLYRIRMRLALWLIGREMFAANVTFSRKDGWVIGNNRAAWANVRITD